MNKIFRRIKRRTERFLNLNFEKRLPRHSVKFAKRYFDNKPITAIEIGVSRGLHALNMLKTLNINKIYLIDPWEDYEGYGDIFIDKKTKKQKNFSNIEKEARKRLEHYKDRIVFIKGYSDKVLNKIPKGIDFIYIDGNHNYEYAKKDMENYLSKIKKGGILAGHDITTDDTGVAQAFVEFCYENKLKPNISPTDWWIVK